MFKHLSDLFIDPKTKKLAHTKLWANVACLAATYKFVEIPEPGADIWFAYLGLVGGYAAARRWIQSKETIEEERLKAQQGASHVDSN